MRKIYVTFLLLMLMATGVYAQVMAVESVNKFQGTDRPAYTIEVPYAPDVTEKALRKYLSDATASKGSSRRGVLTYSGVNLPVVSGEKMDIYGTVERKSRREKDKSVVRLYVSKGYDNFISSNGEAGIAAGAIRFLNAFPPEAEVANKQKLAEEEAARIRKEEKAARKREKKIRKMERQLEKTKDLNTEKRLRLEKRRAELLEIRNR